MRRPGQVTAGAFAFFTPLCFLLGFGAVAWAAECLKVGVQAVGGTAAIVYVVDFKSCSCEVVVAAVGAGVCVSVEYAASGCGGYVFGGVVPSHFPPPGLFVPCSGREPAACASGVAQSFQCLIDGY